VADAEAGPLEQVDLRSLIDDNDIRRDGAKFGKFDIVPLGKDNLDLRHLVDSRQNGFVNILDAVQQRSQRSVDECLSSSFSQGKGMGFRPGSSKKGPA
jgi:hypothetical protein